MQGLNGTHRVQTDRYTVKQAAVALGVKPSFVYEAIYRGVLKGYKDGSKWIIMQEALDAFDEDAITRVPTTQQTIEPYGNGVEEHAEQTGEQIVYGECHLCGRTLTRNTYRVRQFLDHEHKVAFYPVCRDMSCDKRPTSWAREREMLRSANKDMARRLEELADIREKHMALTMSYEARGRQLADTKEEFAASVAQMQEKHVILEHAMEQMRTQQQARIMQLEHEVATLTSKLESIKKIFGMA